jgi:hypothetical protein
MANAEVDGHRHRDRSVALVGVVVKYGLDARSVEGVACGMEGSVSR